MLPRTIALSVASLAVLAGAACSSGTAQCHVGADCASGACNSSGQCVPAPTGGDDAGGGGFDSGIEAAVESGVEASPGDDAGSGCVPDDSGVITRAQVPMLSGVHGTFAISTATVTMNTAGTAQPDGTTDWDFSAALPGDQTVIITTNAPQGQWFSSQFTSSTYTSTLSESEPFLGVYQATAAALLLQGVVTPTNGSGEYDLSYSPSAEILAVPLQMGTTWTSTSTVTGTADGIPDSTYTEKYASVVDAHGTLKVPYGSFQVLRVQTTLTRTIAITDIETTQTMTFIAPCFGPVARLTSKTTTYPEAVPGNAFTSVVEAWRLSP
ncbi:MAG TPA: hypothetical protein VGL81_04950 [Polyangiaceae bacterium]|jgi:hypothetical protein